jgi:hypothetical protein
MGNERREARRVNDEARMTNDEGSPNAQMTKGEWRFLGVLGFRHSFVIRHSTFVISFRGHHSGSWGTVAP